MFLKYLVLLCFLGAIKADDQPCIKDGATGVCKFIWQCPRAIDELTKNKKPPQICGFEKNDPVVCCLPNSVVPSQPSVATDPPPSPPRTEIPSVVTKAPSRVSSTTEYIPAIDDYEDLSDTLDECPAIQAHITAPAKGQKALNKCMEYQEQLVYPCVESLALGGGAKVRSNNCKHNANNLIVGGEDASDAEFPHMALLGYGEHTAISFLCGGTIVSDRYILTAGHCINSTEGPVAYALVRNLTRSANYDRNNLYNIEKIIKNPDYTPKSKYNDIALLQTDNQIILSQFVIPACLNIGNQDEEKVMATSWGFTAEGGRFADVLQKVELTKFSDEECSELYPPGRLMKHGFDSRTQLCYGDKTVSKDTCKGDSGGHIQIKSKYINCMYVIVGVTSFGRRNCGRIGQPEIYTRVEAYVPWIESVVWP